MTKPLGKTPKVGIICSPGGHLTEINLLIDAYRDFPHYFITYQSDNTEQMSNVYFFPRYNSDHGLFRKIRWFLRCLAIARRTVREQHPTILISSGGGDLAIPAFLMGKMYRISLLYIEHIGRFNSPSSTGMILYRLSDRFFVQSKALLHCYGKKAEYHGAVI